LAAAAKVFGAKGYAASTVDEIAAAAGVSKGTTYNYFENKQDLFLQLFLSSITDDEAHVDETVARDAPAGAKLEAVLDRWFERFGYYQQVGRLVLEFWATAAADEAKGPFHQALSETYGGYRRRLSAILFQGEAEGAFRLEYGAAAGAALIMAIVDGIGLQSMLGVGPTLDAEYLGALKQAIFDALAVPPKKEG
jgi:AcrR family transcriptional regulator